MDNLLMVSSQYKMALTAVVNLLHAEDPPLDKIIEYYQIISQKKLNINKHNLINLIKVYIDYRQTGIPHKEAVVIARNIALGLDNKFCKTKSRLRNKLAERKK